MSFTERVKLVEIQDYTPNSNKYKKEQEEKKKEEKKLTSVVIAGAKTKKKSEMAKLSDIFISEDIHNVKSYVFLDVLVPAIKKAISDIVTNGIDMILYGDSGQSDRKRSGASKVSYGSYYRSDRDRDRRESVRARSGFDFDDIVFDNRGDAESVLTAMEDVIDQYGVVSVGDLYDLADVSTNNYAINKYGWTDLRSAEVVRTRDGYMIKLPRALPLN